MNKPKFPDYRIIQALKDHKEGLNISRICRSLGISRGTFYNWKSKYGDMELSDQDRLKELEEENDKLRGIQAYSPQKIVAGRQIGENLLLNFSRRQAGYTMTEVAKGTGISVEAYAALESGMIAATLEQALTLSALLKLDTEHILAYGLQLQLLRATNALISLNL